MATLTLQELIPQIVIGIVHVGLTAFIAGAGYFMWWLIKRRIEKKDKLKEKKENLGPPLYKTEHEAWVGKHNTRSEEKHKEVLGKIDAGFNRVHERLDEHLQEHVQ